MRDFSRPRWRSWALPVIGAVCGVWLASCRDDPETEPVLAAPHLGVHAVEIGDRTVGHWRREGFAEMVPPIRTPSSVDGSDHITVWIKAPSEGKIGVLELGEQGRAVLTYPPGTDAARVELIRPKDGGEPRVADVRGTRLFEAGREEFYVLRPRGQILRGFRWDRGDGGRQAEADRLLELFLRGGSKRKPTNPKREANITRLLGFNQCASCHAHHKQPNQRVGEGGLPNRGTDDGGFYLIQTVLQSEVPLERYRPREMNLDDPFITIDCSPGGKSTPPKSPTGERDGNPAQASSAALPSATSSSTGAIAAAEPATARLAGGARVERREDGGVHVHCRGPKVPVARFALRAALAAGDERAKRVCASRQYLRYHMDETAQAHFADAWAQCAP